MNFPLEARFLLILLGLRFPGNTFVGNCFMRILITAGNVPAEISSVKMKNIHRKSLGRIWSFIARVIPQPNCIGRNILRKLYHPAEKSAGNSLLNLGNYFYFLLVKAKWHILEVLLIIC